MILFDICMSFIIILMIHYIYLYLQRNLTSPQVKDLIHRPEQEYKEIVKWMNHANSNMHVNTNRVINTDKQKLYSDDKKMI